MKSPKSAHGAERSGVEGNEGVEGDRGRRLLKVLTDEHTCRTL